MDTTTSFDQAARARTFTRRPCRLFYKTTMMLAVFGLAGPCLATDGLVIRGGTCSADAFKTGAESAQDDNIIGLSANCTTASKSKSDYAAYTKGIKGDKFCVATMQSIEKINATIKLAPLDDNKLHCLVSGKASKLANVLTKP